MNTTSIHGAVPTAPLTVEESGLSPDLVLQLVLKTLHCSGEMLGSELATRLGVIFAVIEPSLELLKRDRLCEIFGGGIGPQSYGYRLTAPGHSRAAAYADQSSYVGKLPVPLSQYTAYMRRFSQRQDQTVSRAAVREAFASLTLSDKVLDQLGPGIAARHSLFVYGPPGNGKTVIAHTIVKLLGGFVAIPHAISVDNEIISIYDPLNHEALEPEPSTGFITPDAMADHRWVRCKRPVVTVGGELTLESLELGFSAKSGLYRAPLQALANGGVLVIDDFGRQRPTPRELLNRWIVPLESRVDHLVLHTGQKFALPFDALVVFATNINPFELLDESFLRRIRYKVYAESPTQEDFSRIFEECCRQRGLEFDPHLVETLITTQLQPRYVQLRGCQPRDLIDHALYLAEYTDQPRALTPDLLAAACATYFLSDDLRPGR